MNVFIFFHQLRNIKSGYCLDTTNMDGSQIIDIEVQPCQEDGMSANQVNHFFFDSNEMLF